MPSSQKTPGLREMIDKLKAGENFTAHGYRLDEVSSAQLDALRELRHENSRLRETPCGRCKVLRDELNQAGEDRDRYRAALEEALEWLPEPERTTIAEVLA